MSKNFDPAKTPRYELDVYRQFIREATPYVSLIIGRKISPKEADRMGEEELRRVALLIDSRVADLTKRPT